MENSQHFENMIRERGIAPEWIDRTIAKPDRIERQADGTTHYLKRIVENDSRWLRVVVNETIQPARRVTAFFDRRLRGQQ